MFKARGADVLETRASSTNDIISNVVGPNGIRIELSELPADSLFRKAMERWR